MQSAIRDYDDLGDDDNGPWAPVAEESSEVEDISEALPLPTSAPTPTPVPAPKEAPVEEAPTPSAPEPAPSPAVNDPTMHIIEPDDEEEKWERVNERKLHTVLPPRAARGTPIAPVRLLWCCYYFAVSNETTGEE